MTISLNDQNATFITYQCAPHTKWAVDIRGILLMNEESGTVCLLLYPQAAIWDVISRGYSYAQTVRMVCAITSLQADEVEKLLVKSLEAWTRAGFLIKTPNYGESFSHN